MCWWRRDFWSQGTRCWIHSQGTRLRAGVSVRRVRTKWTFWFTKLTRIQLLCPTVSTWDNPPEFLEQPGLCLHKGSTRSECIFVCLPICHSASNTCRNFGLAITKPIQTRPNRIESVIAFEVQPNRGRGTFRCADIEHPEHSAPTWIDVRVNPILRRTIFRAPSCDKL